MLCCNHDDDDINDDLVCCGVLDYLHYSLPQCRQCRQCRPLGSGEHEQEQEFDKIVNLSDGVYCAAG